MTVFLQFRWFYAYAMFSMHPKCTITYVMSIADPQVPYYWPGIQPIDCIHTEGPICAESGPCRDVRKPPQILWHAWMTAEVEVQGKRHLVLIDPTIALFSDDISEDIAVWHERMPGYSEAMEKYEATEVIQGEAAAKQAFCNLFSYE